MADGDVEARLLRELAEERERGARMRGELKRLRTMIAESVDALSSEIARARVVQARLVAANALTGAASFHWHAPANRLDFDDRLPRLCGLVGHRKLAPADLIERVHPGDRDALAGAWAACAERGRAFQLEARVQPIGEATRWIAIAGQARVCETRTRPCVVGACADVEDHRRAREAASARALADRLPQLVWIAQPDGTVEYANHRWLETTGAPGGARITDRFHDDDRGRVRERWLRATGAGEALELEARIVCTGGPRWFLVRAVPLPGDDGAIERWIGTCTDVDGLAAGRPIRDFP